MDLIRLSSALAIGVALALPACSSTPAGSGQAEPVTLSSEHVRLEGSIVSVDRSTRVITIRGSEGGDFDFVAGDQVRNFDQLQAGDQVSLDYTSAVALEINPADSTGVGTSVTDAATAAAAGGRPGGTLSGSATVVAEVVAVDTAANTVTVRGSGGNVVTLDVVREDLRARLPSLKVGDLLSVTFSEAVAVNVVPNP